MEFVVGASVVCVVVAVVALCGIPPEVVAAASWENPMKSSCSEQHQEKEAKVEI